MRGARARSAARHGETRERERRDEGALPRSFATSLSKRDPRVRPCSTGASR